MTFIVTDRFFDSSSCETYYEGRTYKVDDPAVLERIEYQVEHHAKVIKTEAPADDGLEAKSRAELAEIAEGLGLQVNASVNKQMLIAMIRGAGK